jgi:SAM-dependent MidA family methyltransferase
MAEHEIASRVKILGNLEEVDPIVGCFFSNELVDAFPVSAVTRQAGHLKEVYVTAEGDELREKLGPLSSTEVAAYVARHAPEIEEGQRVEVNLLAGQWIRTVAAKLARGFVITIDYGELAERLYTPDRPRGTLLTYNGHVASEDFYRQPGEQDLTAHVNFSALIEAGREAGLELTGFTTQERFLLALGEANQFADLYNPGQTEGEKLDARLKLKRLLYPAGMGNVFKVLIQHRGLEAPELSALRFASRERGKRPQGRGGSARGQ